MSFDSSSQVSATNVADVQQSAPVSLVNAAGHHVLLDVWTPHNLSDTAAMIALLESAARLAGAKVLDINVHHFGGNYGLTGVALLAESHMSVHTWPEWGYAAFDIFMCGAAKPLLAAEHIKSEMQATRVDQRVIARGRQLPAASSTVG